MVESRAREEDAFERAAAQLRPDWAGSQVPSESDAGQPNERTSVAAPVAVTTAAIEAEPSVIIQPDIALLVEDASSPQPEAAHVRSGYGVPSAFSRTEATVLTRALPLGGFRALDPSAIATPLDGLDPDSVSPGAAKRARQLRGLAIGGAACVVFGIIVALFSRSAPEPVAAPTPPAVVAPVVQPLPAATPVVAARSNKPAASKPASRAPSAAVAKSSTSLAPTPAVGSKPAREPVQVRGAKKKLAPPVRAAAKPAPVKLAKPTIASKPAPAKPGPKGKGAVQAAKNKPQDASKRARSPIDVLNPWAN